MGKLFVRWLINAIALALAAHFVPGITITDDKAWAVVAVMAVIFGLVNALIRPLVKLLTCLLNAITLGLFTLVINAMMLWLSSWIAGQINVGFHVDGFGNAFLGALLISIVRVVLSFLLRDDRDRRRKRDSDWERR